MDDDWTEDDWKMDWVDDAILKNRDARVAYVENNTRRRLAVRFEASRKAQGLSIRAMAKKMGTSVSQVQRLLHKECGGTLTLRTLFRAGDALGIKIKITGAEL